MKIKIYFLSLSCVKFLWHNVPFFAHVLSSGERQGGRRGLGGSGALYKCEDDDSEAEDPHNQTKEHQDKSANGVKVF